MWLTGVRIILPHSEIACGSIQIHGERIVAVVDGNRSADSEEPWVDGQGLVALPGLIDLCGDLLERELEPRPGSLFPIEAALHEFDKRLAGVGITTTCVALTLDAAHAHWRSRRPDHVATVARMIRTEQEPFLTDLRIHVQCSAHLPDAPALIDHLLAEGLCDLVGLRELTGPMAEVAEVAKQHCIPLAIHQLASSADVAIAHALGIRLCLFPRSTDIAQAAHNQGLVVGVSAPDLVRGQSIAEELNPRESIRAGVASILVADESPLSLLQALFMLEQEQLMPLYAAVALATTNPAGVLGLNDRGAIEPGLLADLVLVAPGPLPQVRMTMRRGVPIYQRM
jgi:alpha-D-ribose 1-methylphosphonate 5-triphosphate diphosphatase